MKPEQLLDAMSELDDELLLDCEPDKEDTGIHETGMMIQHTTGKRFRWRLAASMAACAALVIAVSVPVILRSGNSQSTQEESAAAAYDTEEENAAEEYNERDYSDRMYQADTYPDETETAGEDAGNAADMEIVRVVAGDCTYYELTAENAADYGIDWKALKDPETLTEENLGTDAGEITESSDPALEGCRIYESEYDSVYIVKTDNGFRYFYR